MSSPVMQSMTSREAMVRDQQERYSRGHDFYIKEGTVDALFQRLQSEGELSQPVELDLSTKTPQTDEAYDDLIHSELFRVYLERPQRARAVVDVSRSHPEEWDAYRRTYMTVLQSADLNRQLHAYERMNIWHEGGLALLTPQDEAAVRFIIMLSRIPGFEPEGLAMEARGRLQDEIQTAELYVKEHRRLGNEKGVLRDQAYIEELKVRALTIESAAVHLHRIDREENPPQVAKTPEQIAEETRREKANKAFDWALNGTHAMLREDYARFGQNRHKVDPYISGVQDRMAYRDRVGKMVADLPQGQRKNLEEAFVQALDSDTLSSYIRDLNGQSMIGLDRLQAIDEFVAMANSLVPGVLEAAHLPRNWTQNPEDAAKVKAALEMAKARFATSETTPKPGGPNQGQSRWGR